MKPMKIQYMKKFSMNNKMVCNEVFIYTCMLHYMVYFYFKTGAEGGSQFRGQLANKKNFYVKKLNSIEDSYNSGEL